LLAKAPAHPKSMLPDTPSSRASPLPQGFAFVPTSAFHRRSIVGVSPLAKGPAHSTSMLPDTPLSRASPLPQGFASVPTSAFQRRSIVGVSLLAKRPAHSTSMLPDTPLSRASSLPQGFASVPTSAFQRRSLWERACSRRGRHIQHRCCLTLRLREQARSCRVLRPFQHLHFSADLL
jgi:hypothetical protein